MLDLNQLREVVSTGINETLTGFITSDEAVKVETSDLDKSADDIYGPSVEVVGKKFKYNCILQYRAEDNTKFLDLLLKKYSFIKVDASPDLDIVDLLGELLNIMCGKINLALESIDDELSIEVPYFIYGLTLMEGSELGTLECSLDDIKFQLHYILN